MRQQFQSALSRKRKRSMIELQEKLSNGTVPGFGEVGAFAAMMPCSMARLIAFWVSFFIGSPYVGRWLIVILSMVLDEVLLQGHAELWVAGHCFPG